MRDPRTPDEWQDAADAAHAMLYVHSAVQYGLIEYAGAINVCRCDEILGRARAMGIRPSDDAIDRLVCELVEGPDRG